MSKSISRRVLGRTSLKVTTVGMGCGLITDTAVLAQAADLGINHFDTARDYQGSNSAQAVGSVLKSRRKNVAIATKTGTAELIDGHQRLKKQGKIRFTGVSTHRNHADVIPAVVANPKVDVLECSYNFTLEPAMEGLLESARKAKLGVVAMKVMAGGYKNGADAEKRRGAMLAALKWVLRNPDVHSTAVSMADTDQLEEYLHAMSQPSR